MAFRGGKICAVTAALVAGCVQQTAAPVDAGYRPIYDAGWRDPCSSVRCSGHGVCRATGAVAACTCNVGYQARGLECVADGDSDRDSDRDGMTDENEYQVALELAPRLVFSADEYVGDRKSHWAARPTPDGGVSVFYALSYYEDGGMYLGYTSHLGDSEFIVAYRGGPRSGAEGQVFYFLSAHYIAETDGSAWYPASNLELDTARAGVHPRIWVAVDKHANYPTLEDCASGAFGLDACDEGRVEDIDVLRERNLGQSNAPVIETVTEERYLNVYREWYWADIRFCGWQIMQESNAGRDDCSPIENTYARQLGSWEDGTLGG